MLSLNPIRYLVKSSGDRIEISCQKWQETIYNHLIWASISAILFRFTPSYQPKN